MGRAICLKLASEGADIVVNYSRRQQGAEETAAAARKHGVKAVAMRADVSQDREARRLVADTVAQLGRLDILVNNAGWSQFTPHRQLDALTEELLDRTWAVNVKGPIYVTRAAVPEMLKQGGGRVINITSISAENGAGSSIVYAASKAALLSITKSLARAFARENVFVNAIAPGLVDTGFVEWPAGTVQKITAASPMGRIPTVEDVANAALFLAVDATGVTAQSIFVDCGLTALGPSS